MALHAVEATALVTREQNLRKYQTVFNDDLGKFPEKVHLHTDESVPPVNMPLLRPPIAIRDRLYS